MGLFGPSAADLAKSAAVDAAMDRQEAARIAKLAKDAADAREQARIDANHDSNGVWIGR